jgi:large subunit ribosomal protein L19
MKNSKSVKQVKSDATVQKLSPGDTVKVSFKVKEATRERFQTFNGLVIKVSKGTGGGNFTIRRVSAGIGVEHTFPFASPLLEKVEVVRHGKVRRAKLYYMRGLSAKEARLKEQRDKATGRVMLPGAGEIEEVVIPETAEVEEVVAQETTVAEETVVEETTVAEEAVAEETTVAEETVAEETVETEKKGAQETNGTE